MKRIALLLAVLATAAALFTVFTLLTPAGESETAGPVTATAPAEAPAEAPAKSVEPAELTAPEAKQATPEPAPVATPTLATEVVERRDAGGLVRVPGRVELPGMPADDSLSVEVYLNNPGNRLHYLGDTPHDLHERAVVGANGDFVAEVPEGTTRFWTIARGKYAIAEIVETSLPRAEPLLLEPALGAYIAANVTIPPGAALDPDDSSWTVNLRPDALSQISQGNPFMVSGGGGVRSRSTTLDHSDLIGEEPTTDGALASTGGEASFEIRGVAPSEGYTMTLVPETLAAVETEAFDLVPGQDYKFDWTLTPGGTIHGRVTDLQGNPIQYADIEAVQNPFMYGQGGLEVRDTETDENGNYTLAAVRPGKMVLKYEADGFLDKTMKVELVEGQVLADQNIELDAGSRIAGRVTWPDGTGAANIGVEVQFDPSYMGGMEAFNAMRGATGDADTDDEGYFEVTGLGKGPFLVMAEAEREQGGEATEWRGRLSGVKPNGEDVLLVLDPPMGVAGRVVDDLGEPVPAFSVHARTKTSGMMVGLGAETSSGSFEDDEGRFFLEGLRTGEWELYAHHPGYGQGKQVDAVLPVVEGEEVALVLERAATVSGQVLDAGGNPLPGATVGRKRGLADIASIGQPGSEFSSATTDEEGRFTLEGLSSGAFELVAEATEFAPSKPVGVELVPAQLLDGVVLEMRTGGRILGLIFDDEGDPWAGQTVLCQDPTLSQGQAWATSDGAGEFMFEHLAPGSYQVMTFPRDSELPGSGGGDDGGDFAAIFSQMKFTMAEVTEGEDVYVELGAKPANPVHLTGLVTADGKPVGGTMITLIADGEGSIESMKLGSTDNEGRFSMELSRPGRYVINVQHMQGTGQQQNVELLREIPEKESYELLIELPVGGITGVVKGPGGRPVANARVTLGADGPIANGSFTGGNYAEIWTDEDGRYELRWLRPGAYSVAAGGAFLGGVFGDTGSKTFGRQVQRGVKVDEGRMTSGVNFRLAEPGSIAGRVVDLSGVAVANAAIFLRDDEGNAVDRISGIATDSSGRFEYSSLEPGSYQVVARTGSHVTAEPVTARVREGETADVEVAIDAGSVLVVSLTDREGNHIRCKVTITDSEGNQVNGLWSFNDLMKTFTTGNYSTDEQRVGPLPKGKYKIKAIADDGRDAHKTVSLTGQPERKVKLRLD